MKRFYEFIKSPQAPVFALATMIMTFFQMYAKLYYHHNPYSLNKVLDIFIALIAAGGLSTITFIIIVHSKKKMDAHVFCFTLDFVGGLLFYGKDIIAFYENSAYIEIGSALFIPFFKASSIYFVGEIFLEEVNSNQDDELVKKKGELKDMTNKYDLEHELSEDLKKQLEDIEAEFQTLKKQSREWKRKSTKYDISNVKRSLNSTTNVEKKKQKEEELQRLEELLEGINAHPNGNGHAPKH